MVGGTHTTLGLQETMDEIDRGDHPHRTEIPDSWNPWPCQAYFFEDSVENHWSELLAIGNIDNESIALPVSFVNKFMKLRELFVREFGSAENYRKLANIARSDSKKKTPASAQLQKFSDLTQKALVLKIGTYGHMRSLVALDEENFQKLTRVLYRDFPLARGRGKPRKKDEEKDAKPLRPIGAATEILEFANLPSKTLSDILDSLLDGHMTLKDEKKEAREAKALIRMVNEFEKRFNDIVNPTRSHKKRSMAK